MNIKKKNMYEPNEKNMFSRFKYFFQFAVHFHLVYFWNFVCETLPCTGYNLSEAHFTKKPRKVLNLRPDTLSQLISTGNVCAGKKVNFLVK